MDNVTDMSTIWSHHAEKILAEFTFPCGTAAKTNSTKLKIPSRITFLRLNMNANLPQTCKLKKLTSAIAANFYGEGSSFCVQVLNSEFTSFSCLNEKTPLLSTQGIYWEPLLNQHLKINVMLKIR